MLCLSASINRQHRLFSNAKLFILIINSDRKIHVISDSQASESATSTLFGMNPEKGRWIFVALGLATNICWGSIYSWSVFWRPLQKLSSIDAADSLLPSIFFLAFFALLMPFAGGPLDKCGPLQTERIRVMKNNTGE